MNVNRVIEMLEAYRDVMRTPSLAEQGEKLTCWAQSITPYEVEELILVVRLLKEAQREQLEDLDDIFARAIHTARCME